MKSRWTTLLVIPMLAFAAIACDDDDQDDIEDAFDDARTQVTGGVDDARTQVTEGADVVRTEVAERTDDNEEGGAEGDQPDIQISSPEDGETVSGDVTIEVDVDNFDIVDNLGEPAEEGEGHVHFYLDVAQVPTTPGQPAVTAEGTYHAEAATSYTWEDLEPGEHTLAVQLTNNDHTPLDPPVTARITVTVE
jgi:hypothetical protein